jgi:predicted GTPase
VSRFMNDFMRQLRTAVEKSGELTKEERQKIARGISEAQKNEPPPVLVLIGETGVGKSTTINALFNAGQEVGHTRATTEHAYAIPVEIATRKGELIVVDMPGLGDDVNNYAAYRDLYLRVLPMADAVIWIHPAADRMVHLIQVALSDLFENFPALAKRLVFGLNKADEISPGDWNPRANLPSSEQMQHLAARERDFTAKVGAALPQWRGNVISYSALRRFNLTALFKEMMNAVPEERRWVLEERMDLADFTELVDRKLIKAAGAKILAKVPQHADPLPSPAKSSKRDGEATSHEEEERRKMRVAQAISALPEAEWRSLRSDPARMVDFIRRAETGSAS